MKCLVVQLGARHHYAVPRILEQAGLLSALHTDTCADRGLGRLVTSAIPESLKSGRLGRLGTRHVAGVPHQKIRTADTVILYEMLARVLRRSTNQRNRMRGSEFSRQLIRWGTGEADTVYGMWMEGREFLRHAKSHGLLVVDEVYENPVGYRVLREERERFPGWEAQDSPDSERRRELRTMELMDIADVLICPSDAVIRGLRSFPQFDGSKIRLVPYACSLDLANRVVRPQPGRILFPASPVLGKGIHYFAEASVMLAGDDTVFDLRVAGDAHPAITKRVECRHLHFLGRVASWGMVDEYMAADVVVLPTLTEGSATVIYEALAAGVPVITTASAGSVVTDGVEGFIVAERDAAGLAHAIRAVVNDRARRAAMSAAARKTASLYTEARWAERLESALMSVESPGRQTPEDRGPLQRASSS